jgi:glycosyltransferase involved in cell wall biosynthesis
VSKTLVILLSGDVDRVREVVRTHRPSTEKLVVTSLPAVAADGARALVREAYSCVAIVGAPPTDEVGYGLASLLAVAARPAEVLLIDTAAAAAHSFGLARHFASSMPFAASQVFASGLAVGAQAIAARLAARTPITTGSGADLESVLYLRPTVGSLATVGGSVTHSHEVIRALRREAVAVIPITADWSIAATARADPDPPCEWRVVRTNRTLKALPASAAVADDVALVRAGKGFRGDLIYQRHTRFSLCGALLSRITHRPLFLEYNGSEEFKAEYWNRTPLRKQLARCERAALLSATRIFVVSAVDRDAVIARGIEPHRVIVNPNGVAAERFARGGGAAVRARLGVAEEEILVGFLGTFGPWHGAPVLARAFCRSAHHVPRLRLLLIGDGVELEATRAELRAAGLDRRAVFVGKIEPIDVPQFLDACDFLASPHVPLPDHMEFFGSPTKLFEYMAAGKAIVASRLGQIGDVLEHEETALLVEPGDEEQLAAAMTKLAGSSRLREELGKRAREQAVTRHSWRENARRVIEAYRSLNSGDLRVSPPAEPG